MERGWEGIRRGDGRQRGGAGKVYGRLREQYC